MYLEAYFSGGCVEVSNLGLHFMVLFAHLSNALPKL